MKYIMTTKGKIEKKEMGFTYEHEHLYTYLLQKDGSFLYDVTNKEKMKKELQELKKYGCDTIVDASVIGMGRNVEFCHALSLQSGINVICSTGFYRDEYIPLSVKKMNDMQVYNLIMQEIKYGINYTSIKPGMLKIGFSKNTIKKEEYRIAEIMCEIQKNTGMPLYVHHTDGTCALETSNFLLKNGAIKEKVILGHVDVPKDRYYIEQLCSLGLNVSMDKFGRDYEYYDKEKVDILRYLINKKYIDNILVGGDMGNIKYLHSYNGSPGLVYILKNLVPFMEKEKISKNDIKRIFINNPSNIYSF